MIKVNVMYPNKSGARFDHVYYREKHMPLVQARMGDKLKKYSIDKGVAGGAPGSEPTYLVILSLFCESAEAFAAGFGPHAQEILSDIPKYTDVEPIIQVSEIVVG
jgi:uncharacterized protein (TIGR02118 family)